jgi:hypothetical protein
VIGRMYLTLEVMYQYGCLAGHFARAGVQSGAVSEVKTSASGAGGAQ